MPDLSGQRILVIGGTAGIGYACAARMQDAGATVTLAGRNRARGEAAAAKLGAGLVIGDASEPAQAARMVAEAAEAMGGLDVLLSGAGGDPMPRLLKNIPIEELMGDITRSLAPVILPARAAYDLMAAKGAGCILMIASDAGKLATPGEAAIGAAMAGIAMFARGMATEGKRNGIRVNCLTPSIVRGTPLYDKLMTDPFAGKLFGKAEAMAQLGVAEPDDLAHLATFLASPAARRITGQTISVTGGISAI
ncbi:SDR family NAD(P)-dependent oxidoreductase [Seohaeicola zhoushanensis]|uniref:2-hydroxycyclohexane-1-carbonyl-CoA dehydrogenase n=1 Tax=Seohaeicola zhoushanensis TaxID=1569283 RepID=A0A8J3H0D6_9RHOB|nr:SDR family oxidoreductase [Seohaeicola zhoushanensis]GHF60470.1 2-hydroxycyclohexane-1-carbonyl-CoA dehydrogenase [Seohaeicola zhoushanensis]